MSCYQESGDGKREEKKNWSEHHGVSGRGRRPSQLEGGAIAANFTPVVFRSFHDCKSAKDPLQPPRTRFLNDQGPVPPNKLRHIARIIYSRTRVVKDPILQSPRTETPLSAVAPPPIMQNAPRMKTSLGMRKGQTRGIITQTCNYPASLALLTLVQHQKSLR